MYFMSSCFPVKSVRLTFDAVVSGKGRFLANFRALGGDQNFLTGKHEDMKYMKRSGRERGGLLT
jgi:hypothetical protein